MPKHVDITIHVDTRPFRCETRWMAWALKWAMRAARLELWLRRIR